MTGLAIHLGWVIIDFQRWKCRKYQARNIDQGLVGRKNNITMLIFMVNTIYKKRMYKFNVPFIWTKLRWGGDLPISWKTFLNWGSIEILWWRSISSVCQGPCRRGRAGVEHPAEGKSQDDCGRTDLFLSSRRHSLSPIDHSCYWICFLARDSKTIYIFSH